VVNLLATRFAWLRPIWADKAINASTDLDRLKAGQQTLHFCSIIS